MKEFSSAANWQKSQAIFLLIKYQHADKTNLHCTAIKIASAWDRSCDCDDVDDDDAVYCAIFCGFLC